MKLGPRPHDSDSSANRSPRSGCCGSMTVISRITRSKMGADPDDRRSQDGCPVLEGEVRGDDGRTPLVALREGLEEQLGSGCRKRHVAKLVDDQ